MTSFCILLTMTAQKHKLYKTIINLYFCILTQHLEWFWLNFSLCVFDDFRLFVSFHIFHRFVVFIHFCFKQHFSVTWTLLPASRNSQSLLLSFWLFWFHALNNVCHWRQKNQNISMKNYFLFNSLIEILIRTFLLHKDWILLITNIFKN